MRLIIERPSKEKSLRYAGTVRSLLEAEGINPETVLAVRSGELVGLDEELSDTDELRLLSVISGG